MPSTSDTIFALSTGTGKSAVAIIRVSGSLCGTILQKLCKRTTWPSREAVYSGIFDESGALIDRALVLVFNAPRSFTGENTIEFHITGSRGVRSALLRNLKLFSGTRLAEPGEFARRAFENGKIDLLQVEGLAAIVSAETEAEARHAALMAFGTVSRECELARTELLLAASQLASFLDFSDIDDPNHGSAEDVRLGLMRSLQILQTLLARGNVAERLREGYTVAIIGKPNVGKSTLINCILQRDAVLVSEIPGTTRDYLEFFVEIGGFPIVFVDTAGFRETLDPIEHLGIQKSKERIRSADLILWLTDSDYAENEFVPEAIDALRVLSKCDLPSIQAINCDFAVSARTGDGISELLDGILSKTKEFFEEYARPGLGSERQIVAVSDAIGYIKRALDDKDQPDEVLAEHVRGALMAVGRVTGRVDVEHVLDEVFSRLCVGK